MEIVPTVLAEPDDADADSLVSSNDPDDLVNEQTWPTEEEMNSTLDTLQTAVPDATAGTTPRSVRRIPKGMSEYQAAWIIDDDDDNEDEDEDDKMANAGSIDAIDQEEEEEEMQDMPMDDELDIESRRSVAFQDLDADEEEKQ